MQFIVAGLNWEKPFTYASENAKAYGLIKCVQKATILGLDVNDAVNFQEKCGAYPAIYFGKKEMRNIQNAK